VCEAAPVLDTRVRADRLRSGRSRLDRRRRNPPASAKNPADYGSEQGGPHGDADRRIRLLAARVHYDRSVGPRFGHEIRPIWRCG
jgi:hypothetical protein